ncbi:MAG TPA: PilZ domain-containing protein [Acidimicrobiia bacterium]|nr:PilZ domain-containing protein [Acidimicrobiia bacterium]
MKRQQSSGVMIQGRSSGQRRAHVRVPVCTPMRLTAEENGRVTQLTGHVLDVSITGCAARVYAVLEPDMVVRLAFEMDGEPMQIRGRIMWSKTKGGGRLIGIRFEGVRTQQAVALQNYIAQQQGRRLL